MEFHFNGRLWKCFCRFYKIFNLYLRWFPEVLAVNSTYSVQQGSSGVLNVSFKRTQVFRFIKRGKNIVHTGCLSYIKTGTAYGTIVGL